MDVQQIVFPFRVYSTVPKKSSLKSCVYSKHQQSFLLKIRGGIRQTSYDHFTVGLL
jgi:hypothetical protein